VGFDTIKMHINFFYESIIVVKKEKGLEMHKNENEFDKIDTQ
jgi:hypothetical protein